jgi:predicted AAA+ superfamily ATPase
MLDTAVEQLTTYGGYPSVVLSKNTLQKNKRLDEIFSSYIQKDVRDFLNIKNEQAFINLITVLASTSGNIINKNEISNTLSIHINTLESYLHYLEQTFVIDVLRPFFKNTRKEIVKSPKIYFNDIGSRNFSLKNFNTMDLRSDKGFIFENLIYMYLKDSVRNDYKINFWRTKAGAEIDFVIQKGLDIIGIEVKAKKFGKDIVSQAIRSFIKTYKPKRVFIVNFNYNKEILISNTGVEFITLGNLYKRDF